MATSALSAPPPPTPPPTSTPPHSADRQPQGRSFAGRVWRLLVGIKDGLVLVLLLLFFSLLFAALSFRPSPAAVRDGALLLELEGVVVEEATPFDPITALFAGGAIPTREYEVRDLVDAIDGAASDERIEAIALDLSLFMGGGQVHMDEIASALDRFRAADKPVIAYSLVYTDDAIMLASHASEVWVDPLGGALLQGPGGERLYFGELFERYGITANVYRVGTYKSAVEPFILSSMSPEARENAQAIYAGLWEEWLADVARARPAAQLERVAQDLPAVIAENGGDLARAALAAGLVDKIGTRTQWGARVAEVVGVDELEEKPGSFVNTGYDTWLAAIGPERVGGSDFFADGRPIGIVTVAGEIVDGEAGPGAAGAERIARLLDDALDRDLAALVVRIDSPGGTVTGGETIRQAILRHKAKGTPVVVSMANVAASGGYWIATPADRIFAEPATLTGSIGVFAVLPSFEELLGQYGVNSDGVRTTPFSGQPDLLAGLTPETDAVLQAGVEGTYARFLRLVARSRNMTVARADELGQGRVWTGGAARQLGLVDQFGGLDEAVNWGAAKAGLKEGGFHPVYLESPIDPFVAMLGEAFGGGQAGAPAGGGDMFAVLARGEREAQLRFLGEVERVFSFAGVQARCLECLPAMQAAPRPATRSEMPSPALAALLRLVGAAPH